MVVRRSAGGRRDIGQRLLRLFVLPESLKPENRRDLSWARANPFSLLAVVARDRLLARLALAWSCTWVGLGAVQSTLVLFAGYRFGWGAVLNGLVLAGVGLSQAVVEGFLLRYVTGRVGPRMTAVLGYVAGASGYAALAAASAAWTVWPAVALIDRAAAPPRETSVNWMMRRRSSRRISAISSWHKGQEPSNQTRSSTIRL